MHIQKNTIIKRFFDKVDKGQECWIWTAATRGKTGYGALKVDGKVIDAHRVSYNLHFGKIPLGMYVCHTCDNRKCVNPKHLFLGSPKDNWQDAYSKGKVKIPNRRSLSESVLRQIKKALSERNSETLASIGKKFNISRHIISKINSGKTYKK